MSARQRKPYTDEEFRQLMREINKRLLIATGIVIAAGVVIILLAYLFTR